MYLRELFKFKIFPKDWTWQDKLMIVLGVLVVVGFSFFLFVGCSSTSHCALEVMK